MGSEPINSPELTSSRPMVASGAQDRWCGRGESNPHGPEALRIFVPATTFAAAPGGVCGLDYPFAVPRVGGLGAARLVSTPSRDPEGSWAWLGIAISKVSPTLSSSASPVSRRALK